MVTRKHKAENKAHETEPASKKVKSENNNCPANGKSTADIAADFEKFCKATWENLSIEQLRQILDANGQDTEGSDDAVVPRCQDKLFHGLLDKCPVCGMFQDTWWGIIYQAEAARYGFTAVDRQEGFLVLAVASLGGETTEIISPPEDTKSLEEEKLGVKVLGRKKTDESEHFVWKDDIKVPCGRLVPSEHKDSALKYNEYAIYDPNQVSIRFLVGVKFEEQNVVYETTVVYETAE